jgi:hypothetical protein
MRRILLIIMTTLSLAVPAIVPSGVALAVSSNTCPSGPAGQELSGIGESGNDCNGSGVNKLIKTVVSILSLIVGVAAIIMIMVGGFKYITSGGDSNKVGNAKSTLIYALAGLAIAALTQVLVHYVLFHANKVGT